MAAVGARLGLVAWLRRKNYQGSRSEAGARVAALYFSLLGSARNQGVDPRAYLLAIVNLALRSPDAVLTPWDYAASLAAAAEAAAAEASPG